MSALQIPTYPAIRFVVRYGRPLAVLLALLTLAVGVTCGLQFGWIFFVLGLFAAVLVGASMVVLAEVMTIIAETLMPR